MVEFDGAQHHYPVDYFNGIEGYISDNENDARKTIWCIENGYQFVRLNHMMNERIIVRILNYFVDGNNVEEQLEDDNVDNIVEEHVDDKDKIFKEFYQFELKKEKRVYLLKCLSMLNKFATQLFNKERDYFTREELRSYLNKYFTYQGYVKNKNSLMQNKDNIIYINNNDDLIEEDNDPNDTLFESANRYLHLTPNVEDLMHKQGRSSFYERK